MIDQLIGVEVELGRMLVGRRVQVLIGQRVQVLIGRVARKKFIAHKFVVYEFVSHKFIGDELVGDQFVIKIECRQIELAAQLLAKVRTGGQTGRSIELLQVKLIEVAG